jgi:lipopolysaccharide transport system permease protein
MHSCGRNTAPIPTGAEVTSPAAILNADSPPEEQAPAPAAAPEADLPVTVIERKSGWQLVDLRELWKYRELLFFLAWRDVKVRYKQTALGAAWAILQPLATMAVFTVFLGRVASAPADAIAYPLFVFAGLLPWTLFSNAISAGSQSVVGSQNLVTKIYFPRLVIPISAVGASLVDFAVALGMLAVMMAWYGVGPGWGVLVAPVILLLLVTAAVGVGTLLAALTVAYRDFRYVVPFGVQLWMFATPCIYLQAGGIGGAAAQYLLPVNPAYGLILTFRQSLLGGPLDGYALAVSGTVSVVMLIVGCLYFRRVERTFADVI